jgi:hypothetical protein
MLLGHSSVWDQANEVMIVTGGYGMYGSNPEDTDFYNFDSVYFWGFNYSSWSFLNYVDNYPEERCYHGSALLNNKIYIYGGISDTGVEYLNDVSFGGSCTTLT